MKLPDPFTAPDAHVRGFNVGNAGGLDAFKENAARLQAEYQERRLATAKANDMPHEKITLRGNFPVMKG